MRHRASGRASRAPGADSDAGSHVFILGPGTRRPIHGCSIENRSSAVPFFSTHRELTSMRIPRLRPEPTAPTPEEICDAFACLYYERDFDTWRNTTWLGVPVQKNPADLWVYQELLHELRPELIVETGTYAGGSALFLAAICDILGVGSVVTVDIDVDGHGQRPRHERVTYLG